MSRRRPRPPKSKRRRQADRGKRTTGKRSQWCSHSNVARRLPSRSGADPIEELTDKTERVNLIVVPACRETQQLGPQVSKPWCALPNIEAEHRHTAAHGLRVHGLVAAADELLAACVGLPLDCAALKEWAHARNDLPVLLGPERRLPLSHQIATSLDPDIGGRTTASQGLSQLLNRPLKSHPANLYARFLT
jgi:hypothetical protein